MKEIPLNHGQVALVDDEDYEVLARHKWSALKKPVGGYYSHRSERGRVVYMHRVIAGAQQGQCVDHANHNGLDNRRENLRLCNQKQNSANMRNIRRHTSRFKGVSWNAKHRHWCAFIKKDGKTEYLGAFDNECAAAAAYDSAAQAAFGEFALTNGVEAPAEATRRPSLRRLSESDVLDIACALQTLPVGQRQLARAYGVASSLINRVAQLHGIESRWFRRRRQPMSAEKP